MLTNYTKLKTWSRCHLCHQARKQTGTILQLPEPTKLPVSYDISLFHKQIIRSGSNDVEKWQWKFSQQNQPTD